MLGSGYDLMKRTVKLSPLHDVQMQPMAGGPTEIDLSFIENASALSQFLKVGAEGAYDALAFKASVKAQFVEETQINKYSLLFVVHCKCIKDVEILQQPQLSETAGTMAADGHFTAFRRSYGDYYVSTLTRGGELFGMIQINTRSESEREQLLIDLDQVVTDQQAKIMRLEELCNELIERVRAAGEGGTDAPHDERPPHY